MLCFEYSFDILKDPPSLLKVFFIFSKKIFLLFFFSNFHELFVCMIDLKLNLLKTPNTNMLLDSWLFQLCAGLVFGQIVKFEEVRTLLICFTIMMCIGVRYSFYFQVFTVLLDDSAAFLLMIILFYDNSFYCFC